MDLLGTKLLAMFLLGGISLLIGILVWKASGLLGFRKQKNGRRQLIFTSLLLCFGGGVLLATALLHILPEAQEGLELEAEKTGIHWLGELCLCLGFFLVYMVEELVHLVLHVTKHTEQIHRTFSMRKSNANHDTPDGRIEGKDEEKDERRDEEDKEGKEGLDENGIQPADVNIENVNKVERCCENKPECHSDMELGAVDEANNTKYNPKYEVRLSLSTNTMFPNYHSPDTVDVKSPKAVRKLRESMRKHKEAQLAHDSKSHVVKASENIMKDLITVLALSFHAVFEGLAVGLEEDITDVWTLFGAISAHKFVITFCVCVELMQSGTKTLFYFLYLTTFSLVSPLGIGIGLLISELGSKDEYHMATIAVLQGLAGGTIIYVVMFEVLQREKVKEVSGLLQLLCIIIGFSLMLTIEVFGGHSHEHEHEHEHENVRNSSLLIPSFFNQTDFVPLEDFEHDDVLHNHNNLDESGYLVVQDQPSPSLPQLELDLHHDHEHLDHDHDII